METELIGSTHRSPNNPFEEQKAVERYLHEIAAFPILSSPEEAVLARRIRAGDQAALNRLVQ
ncbi:MAG: hypothetical protein HY710_09610, partial [Candidatus Latescibacteria bacterium]|nr:hypothetical protein [Candidatus Latescibacterota bacterium]